MEKLGRIWKQRVYDLRRCSSKFLVVDYFLVEYWLDMNYWQRIKRKKQGELSKEELRRSSRVREIWKCEEVNQLEEDQKEGDREELRFEQAW